MYSFFFLIISLLNFSNEILCKTICNINIKKDFKIQNEPLILKSNLNEILYPINDFNVEIQGGDKVRIYCGSRNFKFFNVVEDFISVQCVNGNQFKIIENSSTSSKTYKPNSFSCKSYVKSEIKVGPKCGLFKDSSDLHRMYMIGFSISDSFLPIISTCFNSEIKSVLWSYHTISPLIKYHVPSVKRIKFIQDQTPYGPELNVENLYSRQHQIEVIAKILNSQSLAEKYIQNDKSLAFFSRGHLAPKGDFIYAAEQLATFHFINVAPQWQYFNGGHWEKVESSVRDLVLQRNIDTSILTLTLGITQLEDEYKDEHDIYLYLNPKSNKTLIKVPKLYAKIVTFTNNTKSPTNKDAVVIIGVNQPYEPYVKLTTNDVICKNVCNEYPWLKGISEPNMEDSIREGYIYCCKILEFIKYLKTNNSKRLGKISNTLYENTYRSTLVQKINQLMKNDENDEGNFDLEDNYDEINETNTEMNETKDELDETNDDLGETNDETEKNIKINKIYNQIKELMIKLSKFL